LIECLACDQITESGRAICDRGVEDDGWKWSAAEATRRAEGTNRLRRHRSTSRGRKGNSTENTTAVDIMHVYVVRSSVVFARACSGFSCRFLVRTRMPHSLSSHPHTTLVVRAFVYACDAAADHRLPSYSVLPSRVTSFASVDVAHRRRPSLMSIPSLRAARRIASNYQHARTQRHFSMNSSPSSTHTCTCMCSEHHHVMPPSASSPRFALPAASLPSAFHSHSFSSAGANMPHQPRPRLYSHSLMSPSHGAGTRISSGESRGRRSE
jgi:hypothetical protein